MDIPGIRRTEIPRAKILNDDGTIEEQHPPTFSNQVAPSDAEVAKEREAERFRQSQMPKPVVIDVKWFSSLNYSDDPSVQAKQKELFNTIHSLQLKAESFATELAAAKLGQLKTAHENLLVHARTSLDKLREYPEQIAELQNLIREASFKLNHEVNALSAWAKNKPHPSTFPTKKELAEYEFILKELQHKVQAGQLNFNEQQQELNVLAQRQTAAMVKFNAAKSAVEVSERQIALLEGKPAGTTTSKRSSVKYGDGFGLAS